MRPKSLLLGIVGLCVGLALTACNNSSSSGGVPTVAPRAGAVLNTATPTVELTAVANATDYRILVTRPTAQAPNPVDITVQSTTVTLPALPDGQYTLTWQALDANANVIANGVPTPFRVLEWPDRFPALTVNVNDQNQTEKGYRLLDFVGSPQSFVQLMALVNLRGEVVWYHEGPEQLGLYMAPTVMPDGSGILVIQLGRMDSDPNRVGAKLVRLDWSGQVVWQTAIDDQVVPHHEVDILPDGRIALLLFDWMEFDGELAEGDVIQILDPDTGAVEWEWNIFDHYTPLTWPTPEEAQLGFSAHGSDWSHSNGFDWDPTRSMFWLSVRHFDALLGISYPSGEVTTILGNRGIGGEGLFSHQHAPEVQPDGTILLWDNGNTLTPQVSAAKQFRVDEANATTELVWSWSEGSFDPAVGDADRLANGNTLVCHGIQSRVIEVNQAGDKVWEIEAMLAGQQVWIYRADHVPANLVPTWLRSSD